MASGKKVAENMLWGGRFTGEYYNYSICEASLELSS